MFTGLIETVGEIRQVRPGTTGRDVTVFAPHIASELAIGDSVAVNGCCLTAVALHGESFTCHAGTETIRRTTVEGWSTGRQVNIERALRVGDRLGGHFVQGHVDCVGRCVQRERQGETWIFGFTIPAGYHPFLVEKGSVAIDGISLTVTYTRNDNFGVAVIPHTFDHTTLALTGPGDFVNIETDILAKYVHRATGGGDDTGISMDTLAEHGFLD